MTKKIFLLFIILTTVTMGALVMTGCGARGKEGKISGVKILYHCPMHPAYISDKPGDCPICGMKLVKIETAPQTPAAAAPEKENNLEEVCVEHNCTMQNCAMKVKTGIEPGERILCPICGEVMDTSTGKVIEIVQRSTETSPPQSAGKPARKLLYYRNPMYPKVTSPVPAKDPMGMDYVPVYEEEGPRAAGLTIMISPEKQQLIGVKTEPVKKINLEKIIHASGKIAYDPELFTTQEEFIQALVNEENTKDSPLRDVIDRAKAMTAAARSKLKLLGMNEEQISEIEKTKKAQTNLYLPREGEPVWAYISIYEYEIGLVKTGASVDIEAVAYPGETFTGTVMSINPVLDAPTRTNQVRAQIPNPQDKLKPEMFIRAIIHAGLGEKLAVPETAVLDTGLRKIVYLSKEGDLLESREVKLGQKAEGYYEVLDGLSEGDIVVTSGNFLVDSESKLKSAAREAEQK